MSDNYFEKMKVPIEARAYLKCRYQETDMGDYFISFNGIGKSAIFIDKEILAGEIKNAKDFCEGLVKIFIREETSKNNLCIFLNGEGFEVPKKDVIPLYLIKPNTELKTLENESLS